MIKEMISSNYCVGVYEKAFPEQLSIEEMLFLSKNAKYDYFELSIDRTEKRINRLNDKQYIYDINKAIDKIGIPISSIGVSALGTYTLGNTSENIRNIARGIFLNAVDFALELGARIIQIPAADMPKFEERSEINKSLFFKNLKEVLNYASMKGIMVGIENMENDFMDTTEKVREVIEYINSPYLVFYTDAGNLTNAFNEDIKLILQDMQLCNGRLAAFHIKEVKKDKYGGLYYGEGIVDFESIVKRAYQLGSRRFTMEYWYTGRDNWKDELIEARRLCDSWIEV